MICIKVEKNRAIDVISNFISDIFSIFTDGKYIYIEVNSNKKIEKYEVVDCSKIKKRTPRLSDLIPGVRSFYLIGDILLISPKKEVDTNLLSQIILKINPKVKTIFIRKKVEGELRINELKFIGGEYKTTTIYRENNINFFIDIAKVYVNPSLANERLELSKEIECNKYILDAFCGYGAFTLYLLLKCYYIVAGDLNIDGLYMLKKSLRLNKLRGYVDIVQYDASFLPFRDKAFNVIVADNPTMIVNFKEELCRIGDEIIFYVLAKNEKEAKEKLGGDRWVPVNDYSKDLRIFKGKVRC
ncbi:class I SAM-dependent methyltransferase [Sulfurisphaera ohwakuensis]|uniref:Methyltransferase domain-containing protein n=1 Tax=Sulfurisphaera ohwakuensis TaxID=69656 RepID=A0A650CIS2_SULOH|nr:methyltransferase domain-containing protein [Sulfurisphaera ohwakuensis]MBB5253452.1 tRNA wybutosine-synthesizing protein 2 [Sulfurisphaera ohwakuensis]QGR17764.1 methyltransferase domain-containing protein [Sulfurisphaera ohwakuensis]